MHVKLGSAQDLLINIRGDLESLDSIVKELDQKLIKVYG